MRFARVLVSGKRRVRHPSQREAMSPSFCHFVDSLVTTFPLKMVKVLVLDLLLGDVVINPAINLPLDGPKGLTAVQS